MQEQIETSPVVSSRRGWKTLLGLGHIPLLSLLPFQRGAVMRAEERHTSTESSTTLGRWCSAGSVLAAFAMGICCIGPMVFVALGLSSFASLWVLRHLAPYRNLFLLLTVVFLGLGFYATYRQGRTVRWLDKGMLWASALLVLALLGYSFSVEGFVLF